MANVKQEGKVIRDFIRHHPNGYFTKNVNVGKSMISEGRKKYLQNNENLWKTVTKQIDLVWDVNNDIWLLEAKWTMDTKALGQLLCYKDLYERDHPNNIKEIKLGLVCHHEDELIKHIFAKFGIEVFIA